MSQQLETITDAMSQPLEIMDEGAGLRGPEGRGPEAARRELKSAHRELFVETAASLGAKVCRDALWAKDKCNWMGVTMEPLGGRWRQVHKVFGPEFYGGTSGVALALASLDRVSGDRVFRRTSLAAMRHALARAEDIDPPARVGLYSGWLGVAFAALRVADLLGEESLREPALKLVASLTYGEAELFNEDVLAGCAGALVGLLRLREQFIDDDDSLTEAAARLGDHLIRTAVRTDAGWSWGQLHLPESGAFGNLNGYSHGAGGIGWALLELYEATGESRFREAAESAFRYERHWFDPATGNWPDLRDPELSGMPRGEGPSFMNAWCHGAPGIGLSRLRAYEMLGCEVCRREAETAIETTITNLYGDREMSQTNYSLCHGLGGNCETLIYGAQVLRRPELFARAEEVALRGVESYEAQRLPWACGGPGSVESASLMLGLAGICYFYLRMADPAATPSVLIFLPQRPG